VRGIYVPIEKRTLTELYVEREMSIPDIANDLGTNLRVVHRRLIEHGIPKRNPGTRLAVGLPLPPPATVLTPQFLVGTYRRQQMTMAEIAAQTGFSTDTVSSHLRRTGIPIRHIRSDIERKELVKLMRQGLTMKQIAAGFGCSNATVEPAFRRYGILAPSQPTIIDRIDPKKLAKLRREGFTVAEITDQMGYSKRGVERALPHYGIGR
jgi:DNA-binding CsgD family transcriptional regulator